MFGVVSNSFGKDRKIGIRAGYQVSNMYFDNKSMSNALGSFYVGGFLQHKMLPLLHFEYGAEFLQNGYAADNDNKLVLSYISVPVDFKVKLGPFFALAGAAANIKLSEKQTLLGIDMDPVEKANGFDVPIFAGLGFKISIFHIEARYSWGTMALYGDGSSAINPYKSQYFQIGLGISL